MKQLHHDGHGLNDALDIQHDARGAGGASHRYIGTIDGEEVLAVWFQHGPRGAADSVPGVTDAALLAILIDRYDAFQAGPFPSQQGDDIRDHLRVALNLMKDRADERAARGVLGSEVK